MVRIRRTGDLVFVIVMIYAWGLILPLNLWAAIAPPHGFLTALNIIGAGLAVWFLVQDIRALIVYIREGYVK